MNKILQSFCVLLALFTAGPALYPDTLALYGKKIAFYLDDRTGNFYLENPNPRSRSYKELLFKDDPPSSYVTVVLDGKPYKLGELKAVKPFAVSDNVLSGSFKMKNENIRIDFIMTNLTVKEYDSVICVITFLNPEDPQTLVGARFLFDTVMGESQKKPSLYLSSSEKIDYDRLINQNNIPDFILSGAYEMDSPDFGYGLFLYPYINELKPNSMIIGNWKKLDERELAYTIDPLAKFRYNEFANPDAAVAVFYKDIYQKKGETISIGALLSTSKLKSSLVRLSDAVIPQNRTGLTQIPTVITNYVTNSAINPSNFAITITSNTNREVNALSSQVDLLDRAAYLIDRLDSLLKNTNLQNVLPADNSSLGKGLDNAVSHSPRENPFDSRKSAAPVTNIPVQQQPQSAGFPYFFNNPPAPVVTNIVQTNIYYTNSSLSESEIQRLKEERDRVQKQYEDKMQSLEVYYKELLKKQEEEFKETSSDYKNMLNEKEKAKNKNRKMEQLNSTILSLDKKIDVIGALLELNLDFESMPPEKLEEARALIAELESKIR